MRGDARPNEEPDWISKLVSIRKEEFQEWLGPKDGLVWHYTTTDGLLGILRDRRLWATDAYFLNDRSELEHGRGMLLKMIREMDSGPRPDADEFRRMCLDHLLAQRRDYSPHVCCFSAQRDDLSQWRAYGGSGTGYSVGIDLNQVEKATSLTEDSPLAYALPVVYDPQVQQQLVSSMAEYALDHFDSQGPTHRKQMWIEEFTEFVELFIPILKNDAFAAEKESRLIISGKHLPPEVRFRSSPRGCIPYSVLPLAPDDPRQQQPESFPVKEVVIGPSAAPELAERGIEELKFRNSNYLGLLKISQSGIPYR